MPPRKGKEGRPAPADEREWKDWWQLRDELGKRLGKRDPTGDMDSQPLRGDARESTKRVRKS